MWIVYCYNKITKDYEILTKKIKNYVCNTRESFL
ncbi:hypothetical protein EZS27_013281 [termite gut metagenome]|uniref:Uncharacterized protein n=1 Tax=termite gut metagenome TaxID=433724 RepID=A0A5J4RYR6_9ZZZZ